MSVCAESMLLPSFLIRLPSRGDLCSLLGTHPDQFMRTRNRIEKKPKAVKKGKKLRQGKKLEKKTTLKGVEILTPRLPV